MNETFKSKKFSVRPEHAKLAIDKAILHYFDELSRKKLRRVIDLGGVALNGSRVRKASTLVSTRDIIMIRYAPEALAEPLHRKVGLTTDDIISTDDDLLVINKPPHLASQAQRSKNAPHVEAAWLQLNKDKKIGIDRVFLCHRLDKETSGVLVLAQSHQSCDRIMAQFKEKTAKKTYLALCYGTPVQKTWSVDNYLSPIHKTTGLVEEVFSGGKQAKTSFRLIASFPREGVSLIECRPESGRSHQIRVHLAGCQYPIVGDKKYGHKFKRKLPKELESLAISQHYLHAWKLELKNSSGKAIKLKAMASEDFCKFLDALNTRHP